MSNTYYKFDDLEFYKVTKGIKIELPTIYHYKGCYYVNNLEPTDLINRYTLQYYYKYYIINLIGKSLQEAYENYLLKQL